MRIAEVERSKKPIDTQGSYYIINLLLDNYCHHCLQSLGCGIDRSFYASSEDLEYEIEQFDKQHGTPLNLANRIADTYPIMAIAAEFKKASPSKGDINPDLDPVKQCLEYANVGAAVISVLTEFAHFKGTLNDMKRVRLATQKELGNVRPAILRKDFILDRYQILEARANGADTVLLIVAILGVNQLEDLIEFSRSVGMEPLVEVHTGREMEIALEKGAKVIGVNNRNLHTFQLDLDTTSRAISIAREKGYSWEIKKKGEIPDLIIAALSGITSNDDVRQFRSEGVSCVLVGETLMKSSNPKATITELLDVSSDKEIKQPIIKTCGMKRESDISIALQAGANMLGVIFAESPRSATIEEAKAIVNAVRRYGERSNSINFSNEIATIRRDLPTPKIWYSRMLESIRKTTLRKPLVVGVFQDQPVNEINHIIAETGIDIVQLHGDESPDIIESINAPCIKVLHVAPSKANDLVDYDELKNQVKKFSGKAIALLLDSRIPGSKGGGTGSTFDWSLANKLDGCPVLLAGGLTPSNVKDAVKTDGVSGVDVSSGVETSPGIKDETLLKSFISNSKI